VNETRAPRAGPIGVFDSGVGGLTVLRELRRALPGEDFIYLGDMARLPYGTKSAATVVRYSLQCAAALTSRDIRALVVACNTASASALTALAVEHPNLPVIGVIEPGAEAAVAASARRHIAVIATEGTIAGGAYQAAIRRRNPEAVVVAQACPLFVALAEEGWIEGPIVEAIARRYLEPLFGDQRGGSGGAAGLSGTPDTLVLGCTHFPALKAAIQAVLPPSVVVVDSAATTAADVLRQVGSQRQGSEAGQGSTPGQIRWLATDGAARFARVGSIFFGDALDPAAVEIIDL
jgi:glutamate racemase